MGVNQGNSLRRLAAIFGELSILSILTAASLIILGGCGGGVQGTNTAKIAGSISDQSGTGQENVTVTAFSAAGDALALTQSDETGHFSFDVPRDLTAAIEFKDEVKASILPIQLGPDVAEVQLQILETESEFFLVEEQNTDEQSSVEGDPLTDSPAENDAGIGGKPETPRPNGNTGNESPGSGDETPDSSPPQGDGGGSGVPVPPPTTLGAECGDGTICGDPDDIMEAVQNSLAAAQWVPNELVANNPNFELSINQSEGESSFALTIKTSFLFFSVMPGEDVPGCPAGLFCSSDRAFHNSYEKVFHFIDEALARIGNVDGIVTKTTVSYQDSYEIVQIDSKTFGVELTRIAPVDLKPDYVVIDVSDLERPPVTVIGNSFGSPADTDEESATDTPPAPGKAPPGSFK